MNDFRNNLFLLTMRNNYMYISLILFDLTLPINYFICICQTSLYTALHTIVVKCFQSYNSSYITCQAEDNKSVHFDIAIKQTRHRYYFYGQYCNNSDEISTFSFNPILDHLWLLHTTNSLCQLIFGIVVFSVFPHVMETY